MAAGADLQNGAQRIEIDPARFGLGGVFTFDPADPQRPLVLFIHGGGCNGRYFDLRGFSAVAKAYECGFQTLAIDRAGHGTSPPAGHDQASAADDLDHLFEAFSRIRADHGLDHVPMGVIGHSIGGAVALELVAAHPDLAVGVAVSGVGTAPTREAIDWWEAGQSDGASSAPPHHFFFGPDGTFDWRALIALRRATEPWSHEAVQNILEAWPRRFTQTAQKISCPVHWRMSENEKIWRHDDAALKEIAAAFADPELLDIGILPAGGHLYELHRRGMDHVEEQLDFIANQIEPRA